MKTPAPGFIASKLASLNARHDYDLDPTGEGRNILDDVDGTYGAHWDVSEPYEATEKALRAAIDSRQPFYASWGAKKETDYASIDLRPHGETGGGMMVVTGAHVVDDLDDAVDTLVWLAMGRNEYAGSGREALAKLHDLDPSADATDEFVDGLFEEVKEWLADLHQTRYEAEEIIEVGNRNYDTIMEAVSRTVDVANKEANEAWRRMIECVKEGVSASMEAGNTPAQNGWVGKGGRP